MGRIEQLFTREPRVRKDVPRAMTPEEYFKDFSQVLTSSLISLRLDERISVSPAVSYRSAEEYNDVLTLGILGDADISVATLAATNSLQNVSEDGTPLHTLYFPPLENGLSLLKDDTTKTFWAEMFYEAEGNVLTPIKTDRPIQLDVVLTTHVDEELEKDEALFPGRVKLQEITKDKWKTFEVLTNGGISVPDSLFLSATDTKHTTMALQFMSVTSPDGFVVKATTGSQGSFVQMFDEFREDAIAYASELQALGKDVIVQKRIIPHPLLLPDTVPAIPPDQVDHNLRVLVTIGEDPTILDAEIRYSEKSSNPVNISLGAKALRSHHLLRSLPPDMLFTMYDTSIKAAKALYETTGGDIYNAAGYIGLDVIIDKEGIPYIVEANYGSVGGLGTLSRITESPVEAVTDKLLNSAERLLRERHTRRLERPEGILEPLPLLQEDSWELAGLYYRRGDAAKAEQLLLGIPGEMPETVRRKFQGQSFAAAGDYTRAITELGHALYFKDSEVEVTKELVTALTRAGYAAVAAGLLDYFYPNSGMSVAAFSYQRALLEYQLTGDGDKARNKLSTFQTIPSAKLRLYEQQLREAISQTPVESAASNQVAPQFLTREEFADKFVELTDWHGDWEELSPFGNFLYAVLQEGMGERFMPSIMAIKEEAGVTADETLGEAFFIADLFIRDMENAGVLSLDQKNELWYLLYNKLSVEIGDKVIDQLPQEKVVKQPQTAQLFAVNLIQYRLEAALKELTIPNEDKKAKISKLSPELSRTYWYSTIDGMLEYFNTTSDIAGKIAEIDQLFGGWQNPESDVYLVRYSLLLQEQLGVAFAGREDPLNWIRGFHHHDEQLLREKLHRATDGIKYKWFKQRKINAFLDDPEKFGVESSWLDRFESYLRDHLNDVYNATMVESRKSWVENYGEDNANLIQWWLIESLTRYYLNELSDTEQDIIIEGVNARVRKLVTEILQN